MVSPDIASRGYSNLREGNARTRSKVNWLDMPYDVLAEIFTCCLPDTPLGRRQPEVAEAPMLLCQICSSWRYVALSTPRIWVYLYYVFVTQTPSGVVITAKDLAFLRWWCTNFGKLAPSLRLRSTGHFRDAEMDAVSATFILEQLFSARYLNLDPHCLTALSALDGGKTYHRLNTLVLSNVPDSVEPPLRWGGYPETADAIPTPSCGVHLRRLVMQTRNTSLESRIEWSHLTMFHGVVYRDVPAWHAIIGECVNLVSAEFRFWISGWDITRLDHAYFPRAPNSKHHVQLRQLVLRCAFVEEFLSNFYFPGLTSLRLHEIGSGYISVENLAHMLTSTPSLKELQLSPSPVHISNGAFIPGDISPMSRPLRETVPQLKTIHFGGHLQGPSYHEIYMRPGIVMDALLGPWLSLEDPGNKITRLEFSSEYSPGDRSAMESIIKDMRLAMPEDVQLILRGRHERRLWEWSIEYSAYADIDAVDQNMLFHERL